jgi:ribosomal protein S18 acetylase RimI-like enzyme
MIELHIATEPTDELVAAFRRLLPQLSSSAAPLDRDALAKILGSPTNIVLIARDDGIVVGTLTLVLYLVPTGVRARIEDVVVDASARGRGVGEAMIREALRLAATRGAKTVDLTSNSTRVAANQLYQRIGFEPRETHAYRYVLKNKAK